MIPFALLLLPLVSASCRRPEQPKSEQVLVWQPVGTWTGQGSMQTESFTSQTGTFKFSWEAQNIGPADGTLHIVLHSAVSGRPLVPVVELHGNGKDWAFVNEDPREFYVVVEAEETRWTLTVEEGISLLLTPSHKKS